MELVKFITIRKRHQNKKVGALVALGPNQVGWSKCSKLDIFNKELALNLARGRALSKNNPPLPSSIRKEFSQMCDRAKRYFKGEDPQMMEVKKQA